MKQLLHLLKYDLLLLQRNNIIVISVLVTAIYMGVFRGLAAFGDTEEMLLVVIFNDPALLGFLFVGVMVLLEKNQNTLQALSVSPLRESNYILSKSISLSIISLICCYAMAFVSKGLDFHILHFGFASLLNTLLFSFIGFLVVAGEFTFNTYLLKAAGVLIGLSIPFLGYFDVVPRSWFLWTPTQPAIDLYQLSFQEQLPLSRMLYAYIALLCWTILTYLAARKYIRKSFH